MNIKISRGALRGTVQMISSKSDAHRLFIGAALADQPTEMMINGSSEDLEATLQCLQALGADFLRQGDKIKMFPVEKKEDLAVMDCGESGSTLRFLLPVAAALGRNVLVEGKGRLPQRPIGILTELLREHGCFVSSDQLPLEMSGQLKGGTFSLPGNVSSQFITGLLFALPLLEEDSEIILTTEVGLPSLRLSGSYLTIVTLGFGEIVKMIIVNWDAVTNGTLGLKNIPKPSFFGVDMTLANHGLYYMMLVLVLLVAVASMAIIRSNTGRAFQAIKEDEMAATMMGIRTMRYKVLAFVVSAFITGIAGAFYAPLVGFIDANSFTFDTSVLIISVVIVGGMGTMRGMFLGAALLIAFPEVSRSLMEYRFVVYGLLLVLMMRFRPQGILGWKSQMPYKLSKRAKAILAAEKEPSAAANG